MLLRRRKGAFPQIRKHIRNQTIEGWTNSNWEGGSHTGLGANFPFSSRAQEGAPNVGEEGTAMRWRPVSKKPHGRAGGCNQWVPEGTWGRSEGQPGRGLWGLRGIFTAAPTPPPPTSVDGPLSTGLPGERAVLGHLQIWTSFIPTTTTQLQTHSLSLCWSHSKVLEVVNHCLFLNR